MKEYAEALSAYVPLLQTLLWFLLVLISILVFKNAIIRLI
jgi:hypothetical protein